MDKKQIEEKLNQRIDGVEEKLRNDGIRLKAYRTYMEYKKILSDLGEINDDGSVNSNILLIRNAKHPFEIFKKRRNEKTEIVHSKIKQLKASNPKIKLNDLLTPEGRETIASIISEYNPGFIPADLESVAIGQCLGIYKTVCDAKSGERKDISLKQLPKDLYEYVSKSLDDYEKSGDGERYEKRVKSNASLEPIVHTAAAVLRIGTGEAESSLGAYEVIKRVKAPNNFEASIDIRYIQYQTDFDMIKKMDEIIYDINHAEEGKYTCNEKKLLIEEAQRKKERAEQNIARASKLKQNSASNFKETAVKSFPVRNNNNKRDIAR